MKLKSFKRFLKEEEDKKNLNAFIENTFQKNWNKTKTDFGNFIENFSCKDCGKLYRILFFSKQEIDQMTRISDLKSKISGLLTTENQGHPRFYTKDDYDKIPDHLSFLVGKGEKIHGFTDQGAEQNYTGIIISRKSDGNDNVDFSNYDGKIGNKEIADRIELTKPVLAVNATNFKIVASYEFEDKEGWVINPISKEFDDIGNNDESETTEEPEESENIDQEEEPKK